MIEFTHCQLVRPKFKIVLAQLSRIVKEQTEYDKRTKQPSTKHETCTGTHLVISDGQGRLHGAVYQQRSATGFKVSRSKAAHGTTFRNSTFRFGSVVVVCLALETCCWFCIEPGSKLSGVGTSRGRYRTPHHPWGGWKVISRQI